jgi:short-subunit dehydrogenase
MIHYKDHWAVVTGASSGLGRGLAARLADRGMSLVLTGRNQVRLDEGSEQIRRANPQVQVETVAADLSTRSGVSALLDHVGERPVEVLINNAGFGSYGSFAEADAEREADEVAVDVSAVIALARAFLPGMLARRSGGILNVASTIAFQPAPYQAVYGASKAFVLSFSQALWAEARTAGVAVTALCPGPTRTGFVDALGADVGHTAIYSRLAEPEPVIEAGLRGLEKGRAVVIPGVRNKVIAASGRFMPREWLTRVSARLLRPAGPVARRRSRFATRSSFLLRPNACGRLRAANQAMFVDLARAASRGVSVFS